MTPCLTSEEIDAYLASECSDHARSHIEQHLAFCRSCQQLVQEARDDEAFLEAQRALVRQDEALIPPELEAQSDAEAARCLRTFFDYELVRLLSSGGQGKVYEAIQRDHKFTKRVAVKVLTGGIFASKQDRERFDLEIRSLAALQHPNIVTILGTNEINGQPCFIMEYIEGRSLKQVLLEETWTVDRFLKLFVTVCDAVHTAHLHGLIHRDLKPSNIQVDVHGAPHILDFGLAKRLDAPGGVVADVTAPGWFVGTLRYAAPEQLTSGAGISVKTDLYALGVILYEMLTKTTPYPVEGPVEEVIRAIRETQPPRPSTVHHGLEADLDTIVLRALAKAPDRRYDSVKEMADDIRRCLAGEPIQARKDDIFVRLRRTVRRYKAALPIAVVVALMAIAFGISKAVDVRRIAAQKRLAEENEQLATKHLYAAHMHLTQQALERRDLTHARELLQQHYPGSELLGIPGFEWYYLWRLCNGNTWETRGYAGGTPVSADGRVLVSVNRELWVSRKQIELSVWDLDAHQLRSRFMMDGNGLSDVAVSPDGTMVAVPDLDGVVRLRDLLTGKTLWIGRPIGKRITCIVFSPDSSLLGMAAGGREEPSTVVLRNTHSGAEQILPNDEIGITSLAFSRDGTLLVAGSRYGCVLWDVKTGQLKGRRSSQLRDPVPSVTFSPNGDKVITAGFDGSVRSWHVPDLSPDRIYRADNVSGTNRTRHEPITSVAVDATGSTLAAGGEDMLVRLWDLKEGGDPQILRGHADSIRSVAFTERSLITASGDGVVKEWRLTKAPAGVALPHANAVQSVAFSPDGKLLAVGTSGIVSHSAAPCSPPVALSNVGDVPPVSTASKLKGGAWREGERRAWTIVHALRPPRAAGGAITQPNRMRPDATSLLLFRLIAPLVAPKSDGEVVLWATDNGHVAKVLKGRQLFGFPLEGHRSPVTALTFSPDGQFIITGSTDCTVQVWRIATGRITATFRHSMPVFTVVVSPDGQTVAAGGGGFRKGESGELRVWDMSTRALKARSSGFDKAIEAITFSPDGAQLAVACSNGTVQLWDTVKWRISAEFQAHATRVTCVTFSPDGQRLLTSASSRPREPTTTKIWDIKTRQEMVVLRGHAKGVVSASFTRDGRSLATASEDYTVKLWDPQTGQERLTLQQNRMGVTSVAFAPDGKTLVAAGRDGVVTLWRAATDEDVRNTLSVQEH